VTRNRHLLERAIGGLADILQIDLTLDSNGMLKLMFDDDVSCTIEAAEFSDHVVLYAPIGPSSISDRGDVANRLLELNMFGLRSVAGWLALDAKTGELNFCQAAPLAFADEQTLTKLLLNACDEVPLLRDFVANQPNRAAKPEATDAISSIRMRTLMRP
jgi:hypothetical protein